MKDKIEKTSKWYDNAFIVVALCFFLSIFGIYGLWKSNTISRVWKIMGTAVVLLYLGLALTYDYATTTIRWPKNISDSSIVKQLIITFCIALFLLTHWFAKQAVKKMNLKENGSMQSFIHTIIFSFFAFIILAFVRWLGWI